MPKLLVVPMLALVLAGSARAATYDVGPGQPLAAVGDVPWATLAPGDVVQIHWRAAPYREKWVIARQGTAAAPITVRGVRGPGGERPVIDGDGAVTAPGLNYWSETRGVIKIGGSNVPQDTTPMHLVIEGLEIRNAHDAYTFTADDGSVQRYDRNASSIYLEIGENVVIRDCELHHCGNGFFVASGQAQASRDILVEGNFIHDNGNVGSIFEHNNYTAAIGIVFQYNHFGPPLPGAGGNNLKDRSAGLVVRYNWIEGGNRQLDLVDGEDSGLIVADPGYRDTHVYGNVLVETEASGNRQVIHYGGDSGNTADYRKGTLHLYQNTVVSYRTDRTTLVRLSTGEERCDARNNVVYLAAAAGTTLALLDDDGVLDWSHNWVEPGYVASFDGAFRGALNDDGTSILGASPGFADETGQEFHLAPGSACVDAGRGLEPVVLPAHDVVAQYGKHQGSEARPRDASLDVGAYELCVVAAAPLVTGLRLLPDRRTLAWDPAPAASSYDVVVGDLVQLAVLGLSASSMQCLEDDDTDTQAMDASALPSGGGRWYLVRASNCAATGTWDGGDPAQGSPRDPALVGVATSCP